MNRFLRILQSCTAAQRVDRVPAIPIESAKPENGGLLLNSADSQLSSQHHLSAQAGKGLRNHILFSRYTTGITVYRRGTCKNYPFVLLIPALHKRPYGSLHHAGIALRIACSGRRDVQKQYF